MIRVDAALFSNVSSAVQRTANLTGGSVSGLPGGVVIGGLQGVTSFSADLVDAHTEFKLGRRRTALERVKQIESQFNGIASRWNGTVNSLISSARTGKQGMSTQKLNEVKSAQAKMVQLTGPATKCFRDLITALEHEVALEGHDSKDEDDVDSANAEHVNAGPTTAVEPVDQDSRSVTPVKPVEEVEVDADDLGRFADKYSVGPRLAIQKQVDGPARLVPNLEAGRFYFCKGLEPPAVIRVRELERSGVLILDTSRSQERFVDSRTLKTWIKSGTWILIPR